MALAAVKAISLLGVLLLVGGIAFDRFVHDGTEARGRAVPHRLLRAGVLAGAGLVILAGAADVALTIHAVLGRLDATLVLEYLPATRHGRATLLRFVLVVPTVALAWGSRSGASTLRARLTAAATTVPLLATFSWTSHAAAMGGVPPFLADLAHLAAAAAWGGALLYLAASPAWGSADTHTALRGPLRRISRAGLASVAVLAATGAFGALTHVQDLQRFAGSPYGVTLFVKLGLVAVIVAIAAAHRWVLLPAFLERGATRRLRDAVRVEAFALVMVLVATGALTTRPVPHAPGASADAIENLRRLLEAWAR